MPYMKSASDDVLNSSAQARRHHRGQRALGVGGLDGVERRLAEPSVDPQARARADLHVHVGCSLLHGEAQQAIEVEHSDSRRAGG